MRDEDVLLLALTKEREELHDRLMQIDRIMKKVRQGDYSPATNVIAIDAPALPVNTDVSLIFPKNVDLRVQILRVFDLIGKASKLQDIQNEYDRLNEGHYPLRDTIRSLQNSRLLVMIKLKDAKRGFLWAKKDWVSNGQLLGEYKPEGFDMLYKPENLIFE